jgi:hypothetical protein
MIFSNLSFTYPLSQTEQKSSIVKILLLHRGFTVVSSKICSFENEEFN